MKQKWLFPGWEKGLLLWNANGLSSLRESTFHGCKYWWSVNKRCQSNGLHFLNRQAQGIMFDTVSANRLSWDIVVSWSQQWGWTVQGFQEKYPRVQMATTESRPKYYEANMGLSVPILFDKCSRVYGKLAITGWWVSYDLCILQFPTLDIRVDHDLLCKRKWSQAFCMRVGGTGEQEKVQHVLETYFGPFITVLLRRVWFLVAVVQNGVSLHSIASLPFPFLPVQPACLSLIESATWETSFAIVF